MPIYEYVCTNCGEPVEKLQKLSDAPLADCPACGQASLKRKVSAAGFRLSGGGWYETDFKSDNRRNLTGESNKSSSDSSGNGAAGNGASSGSKSSEDKSKSSDKARKSSSESKPDKTPAKSSGASGD
ncbi:zinc ribbon domain-containing protein [Salinisphaera sp.]|uniref:FmdB family zinc ribbon protein n=1 Tax=Salinisphaera sp. TaxID=1914330 RepID=UPI002D772D82|nr:zinc ribbon domain-containing protein [Salinisphaera sp.]HET7315474.1 zinc ribbon domain-containing protein [Salinisphaera sp.]